MGTYYFASIFIWESPVEAYTDGHVNDVFKEAGDGDENENVTSFPDIDDPSSLPMPSPKVIKRHPLPQRIRFQETKTEEKGDDADDEDEDEDGNDDSDDNNDNDLNGNEEDALIPPTTQQISTPKIGQMISTGIEEEDKIIEEDNDTINDNEPRISILVKQNTEETSVDDEDDNDNHDNDHNLTVDMDNNNENQDEIENENVEQIEINNNGKDIIIDSAKLKSND